MRSTVKWNKPFVFCGKSTGVTPLHQAVGDLTGFFVKDRSAYTVLNKSLSFFIFRENKGGEA